jgi:hypothetical protein
LIKSLLKRGRRFMGEVVEFAPFRNTMDARTRTELVVVGDDPLVTLIRQMMDVGYCITDIATFLREQAGILDQIQERLTQDTVGQRLVTLR